MDDTTTCAVYAKLFPEQVADKCSSDALESNNGPLAYLDALYQQAIRLEAQGDMSSQITLGARRPDIGERVVDEGSLETQVPALSFVIEAMTRQAKLYVGDKKNLAEELAKSQYPVQLPFHYPLEQIKAVLIRKKCSLFDLLQKNDYGFPNFVYANLRTGGLRNLMRQATGFSPALQALLLDDTDSSEGDFLLKRYGVSGTRTDVLEQLTSVERIARLTGLKPEDILDVLATSGVPEDGQDAFTTVKQSSSYVPDKKAKDAPIAGHLFGAAFINNATAPALSLEDTQAGEGITLRIKGATADHFGRIHKVIHLQHALRLPYAEVDLLVMAALRAEGQTKDFKITENTLRALGVFLYLRDKYQITAEQFAALIYEVTPYAVGDVEPFLDRVLDGPGPGRLADIEAPLTLDGSTFELPSAISTEKKPESNPVIAELCRAFGMDENFANIYLNQVKQALGLKKPALTLTLSLFSSLYRLARLPRLFRLSMTDGASLIALLDGANLRATAQLAGKPVISSAEDKPDILDVLIGLVNLETWLREQHIKAASLMTWLTPVPGKIAPELKPFYSLDARITRTVTDVIPRIKSSAITEEYISKSVGSNVSMVSGSTWLGTLSAFIDSQGLVKPYVLDTAETLAGKLVAAFKGKLANANGLLLSPNNEAEVASNLVPLIENAVIAQDDVVKHIIGAAFGKSNEGLTLTPGHALPLLRWINVSPFDLLTDILKTDTSTSTQQDLDIALWSNLARHAQVIKQLKLSAAGLTALLDNVAWFALENANSKKNNTAQSLPVLSLDLCYQVSNYRNWVLRCEQNGFEEKDALDYLANTLDQSDPNAAADAAKRLGELIGWSQSETIRLMTPSTAIEITEAQPHSTDIPKTLDDFVSQLTDKERKQYEAWDKSERGSIGTLVNHYMLELIASESFKEERAIDQKFAQFMQDNPSPLRVYKSQYLPETKPDIWTDMVTWEHKPTRIRLEIYDPEVIVPEVVEPQTDGDVATVSTISDIDYALRVQRLCALTSLSCQSMLQLYSLNENSTFNQYRRSGLVLFGACDEDDLHIVESRLQEKWRDALAGYLLGYWAPANEKVKNYVTSIDDLSSYFLTDILVSNEPKTSAVIQHTASLQHYLHKLFAKLEPGYGNTLIPEEASTAWRQYVCEYGLWKIWQTQMNHPENLIYYANRPNKSKAFQELEVELNQGKLDPELLQTAITSYLTKFEHTSNLQIVSGYLDGLDPKNDTYHFIGKTNASPTEYYWRSVDMGLRDDSNRLSPLAWTEWDKIAIAPSGQITQSSYTETDSNQKVTKHTCDTIRPVMIEGRPYVFWVERGTVGLPSSDEKNQTPTKFKKLSVQYIYKQSDGFWSPPNELMSLDGTKEGKRLPDKDNPFLKDDTYEPGLIALVNTEGKQAQDPWLTIMIYDCAYKASNPDEKQLQYGDLGTHFYIEARDLLLIDKQKLLKKDDDKTFSDVAWASFRDIRKIQHLYSGSEPIIKAIKFEGKLLTYKLDPYKIVNFVDHTYEVSELKFYKKLINERGRFRNSVDIARDITSKYPLLANSPLYPIVGKWSSMIRDTQTLSKQLNERLGSKLSAHFISGDDPRLQTWHETSSNASAEAQSTPLAEQILLPRELWVDAKIKAGQTNTLTLSASFSKIIPHGPEIKVGSLTLSNTLKSGGSSYTLKHVGEDLDLNIDDEYILTIQISSDSVETPSIGYSFTHGREIFSVDPFPASLNEGETRSWTIDLKIAMVKLLLQYEFTANVYLGGKPIGSCFLDKVISPRAFKELELRLYAKAPKETEFTKLIEKSVVADGKAVITWDYPWKDSGHYMFAVCHASNPVQNMFVTYDVRVSSKDKWDIFIQRSDEQAQYLNLDAVAAQPPAFPTHAIRLNTLFGKQLVSRAARSVERALEWDAQLIKEPTIDSAIPSPPVDFHGANGIYFRELFLYLPHLVATRLCEQQQFDEAEHWLTEYLFDPYRTLADNKKNTAFWNTRPLAEVGSGSSTIDKAISPTARAFVLSKYYRQAVFLSLVEIWQRQGDHFYRQLTPSTLNHAWLCYQKALKLIGPLPERTAVSRWVPMALSEVETKGEFRAPINERVIEARKIIEHRLFNLRHGLTLDGKLLPIMDRRTEGADAFGFGQRGIGHLINSYNSDRMQIPAYRFRQLISMAHAAVKQLQDMGRHYMKLMEDEFNTTFSVLLKQQEIRVSDFTLRLQQEAISSVKAKKETMLVSRQMAVFRRDFFANLIEIGRSPREEAATGLVYTAAVLQGAKSPFSVGKAVADAVPCIFGMAVGGQKNSAGLSMAIGLLDGVSAVAKLSSDQLLMESGYERRANDWKFEQKLAEFDIQSIDLQLKETSIELNAATISLEEARANRKNLDEAYVAMTTGFTIIPIYNWLVARQELLYAPAYDAVLSLCLSAEAAWRYEIGDYKRPAFVKTSAWIDSYKGMLAGESLLVDLQEMENAYLQSNERRLTIRKTINVWEAKADAKADVKALKDFKTTPLTFSIKSADFDKNYPGHYLRQLKHVSVSFVMTSDAGDTMKEVSAILTQTDSTTLIEPTEEAAEYVYVPGTKLPASVKRNLRAQQQIALSSPTADDGAGFEPDHYVYELAFDDGRYLPFEGTGAISGWQLSFPDQGFVDSLVNGTKPLVKSIQLHLVYTAVDGGKDFTDQVKALRDKAKP